MSFAKARVAIFAAIAALMLSGCNPFAGTETYRYRLTVEVDTPEGLKTGSSVIQVKVQEPSDSKLIFPEARKLRFSIKGEAVSVDLGEGRVLFALLDQASAIAPTALRPPQYHHSVEYAYLKQIDDLMNMKGAADVPTNVYPQLVTFADLDDPTSVALIDPDDLATSFGEGVSLRRMTAQITNDGVTRGIEQRLGWLGNFPEPSLDPSHGPRDYSLSATLKHGAFKRGATDET